MKEFERKPDGGLSDWIETYEAMGGGENDAEMLCLLLELRRRRENQAEAERERDELRAQFDKLAEAIGWSKAQCEQTGNSPFDVAEALITSKEENTRRDAAASEPVAWKWRLISAHDGAQIGPWRVCLAPLMPGIGGGCKTESIPIYTAAQAAVLPPECTQVPTALQFDLSDAEKNAWISGANGMREHAKALGAQPQKVVELPLMQVDNPFDGCFYKSEDLHSALDAANVKYEVKK